MRTVQIIAVIAGLLFSLPVKAQDKRPGHVEPLPQDLEVQLALSALPPHLRGHATVYSLNPEHGFEVGRQGTNGFHALVARTGPDVYRGHWPFTEYPDDLLIPIAFDSAGAQANMRPLLDIAKLQAEGVSPEKAKSIIKDRYETGFYQAPGRAGISYMLSPVLRAYQDPEQDNKIGTFNFPHYMFYAPNVHNQDIGGSVPPATTYPWAFRPGPHGYIILRVGEKEIAEINKEHEGMLARLCEFKQAFCLPSQNGD